MKSYFDIDSNPAKWGFMRAGAAIFRDYGLGRLAKFKFVNLRVPAEDLLVSLARFNLKYDRNLASILEGRAEIKWQDMLKMCVGLAFEKSTKDISMKQSVGTGNLEWSVKDGKGLYVAMGEAAVLVGHTSRFGQVTDDIRISDPSYVIMTITSLDGMPVWSGKNMLITACGRCENANMKFSEDRRTVGRNWGGPPVRIEAVTGTVVLPEGQWKCEALGPDGISKHDVPVSNGAIKLSPEYGTMWYLLTR
jgi:hypothetical protein